MATLSAETFSLGIDTAFGMLGQSMIVRTVTNNGTFNPSTGAFDGRVVADRIVSGVEAGRERKWINGALVFSDEYVVYVKAATGQSAPTGGDFIVINNEEVAIQSVDPYAFKGTDLAYRVVIVK